MSDNKDYMNMLFEQMISRIDEIKYSDEKKGKTRTEGEYFKAAMKSIAEEWGELSEAEINALIEYKERGGLSAREYWEKNKDKKKVSDMFKSKSLLNSSD